MIKLNAASTTTNTSVFNSQTTTTVTDTLVIAYVELNLPAGSVVAMIQRGTVVNGLFTPNTSQLRIDVQSDGTFSSQDGSWSGTLPNWSASLAALSASLDGLLLSAGLVSGTQA